MVVVLWMSCVGVTAWWMVDEMDEWWSNLLLTVIGLALLAVGVWVVAHLDTEVR
jgi:hypothetical protein